MKRNSYDFSRRNFVSKSLLSLPAFLMMPGLSFREANNISKEETMDEALEMLAATGPEYHGGLANHGPMAAEALIEMGRTDSVKPWVEQYKKGLQEHPAPRGKILRTEWRESLGMFDLVGEWITFFNIELKEKSWKAVLGEWSSNLGPGLSAAAGHGLLRTAHIARRLAQKETEGRRHELAEGLAYWAARYQILPTSKIKIAKPLPPSEAIKQVKLLPEDQRISGGSITKGLLNLENFHPFLETLYKVDISGDASRFISNLTETFATVYVQKPTRRFLISFIHAVTAPSAIRLLIPYLTTEAKQNLLRYGWQLAAGIYTAFGEPFISGKQEVKNHNKEELIDRAIKNGDEHAIKFTEACLREHSLNPKPVYLTAADLAIKEL